MAGEGLRERLSALSRGELVGLVAIVGITLGGAGLWYLRSLPQPVEVRAGGIAPLGGAAAAASPSETPVPLLVDVAGEVRKPGVYEFTEGDRIIDAIDAAGGATSKADLQSLNLAAPVQDGVQVLVPAKVPVSGTEPGTTTGSPAETGSTGALININTADATALEALPGIGEVLSQAIVDYRTQNGPFATVDDLENVSGIGPSIMDDVRDMVTV
ncbi:MAG: helix-hairpin-helix domain-containing protein [Actinomycetota bacterium]